MYFIFRESLMSTRIAEKYISGDFKGEMGPRGQALYSTVHPHYKGWGRKPSSSIMKTVMSLHLSLEYEMKPSDHTSITLGWRRNSANGILTFCPKETSFDGWTCAFYYHDSTKPHSGTHYRKCVMYNSWKKKWHWSTLVASDWSPNRTTLFKNNNVVCLLDQRLYSSR